MRNYNFGEKYSESRRLRNIEGGKRLREWSNSEEGILAKRELGGFTSYGGGSKYEDYAWVYLEPLGFVREFRVNSQGKFYKFDFFSKKYNLLIELDGSIHRHPNRKTQDQEKTEVAKDQKYNLLRLIHNDSFQEIWESLRKELSTYLSDEEKEVLNIRLVQDKVELLSSTYDSKISVEAWVHSRPKEEWDNIDWQSVISIDAPVNELYSIALIIRAPIYVRDMIFSLRDYSGWSQTTRVLPIQEILDISYSSRNKFNKYIEIYKEILKLRREGLSQDNFRLELPLSFSSEFCLSISLRSLVKLEKYLNKFSLETKCLGLKESLISISSQIKERIQELLEGNQEDYQKWFKNYSIPEFLGSLDKELDISERYGDAIIIGTKVPLALRAQIIRHRNLIFSDSFKKILLEQDADERQIKDEVHMEIFSTVEMWNSILKSRQCWISQGDLWSPIINKALKHTTITEKDLPCADGTCPYSRDAEIRYTINDPGSPCPLYSLRNRKKLTEQKLQSLRTDLESRPEFWKSISKELERMG
jgi:very-short-patch-repair endonuclease